MLDEVFEDLVGFKKWGIGWLALFEEFQGGGYEDVEMSLVEDLSVIEE